MSRKLNKDMSRKLREDRKVLRAVFGPIAQSYPVAARLKHYRDWASKRLQAVHEDAARQACREVINQADIALQAAGRGDFDLFAQAFERVIRVSVNLQLPAIRETFKKQVYSDGGKKSKRGPGAERAVIQAIAERIRSTDSGRVLAYWRDYEDSKEPELKTPHGRATLEYDASFDRYVFTIDDEDVETPEQRVRKKLSLIRNPR